MSDRAHAVLIVGAGPRLGAAVAERLGGDGRPVGLIARNDKKLAGVAETLRSRGINAHYVAANVADAPALSDAITSLTEMTGDFDIALHNVSTWRDGGALDLTPQQLCDDVAIGTTSLLTIAQAVAPGMIARGTGTILATGSMAADEPSPDAPSLGVQKAGLRTLVRAMAAELGPKGIHCATITVNGALDAKGFEPERIAAVYEELVAETATPRESWRAVVDYPLVAH